MKKWIVLLVLFVMSLPEAGAATAGEIEASVDAALASFYKAVDSGEKLVSSAKGVLVFPSVYKAGIFLLGAEYGEGALRIDGQTVDYYNTATASLGWQLGAQKKSIIILFMDNAVLGRLRTSQNWKAGVDASIAVLTVGADGSIDSDKINKPIIAFVIDQKGLMYNLTLEGTKFTKIRK